MKPMTTIYWLRIALGLVAAFICIGYGLAAGKSPHLDSSGNFVQDIPFFMNGLSIAIIIYLISYYLIKGKFVLKVEKPQKIFTTGIGIYFLSWIVFWVLMYTIIAEQLNLLPP